MNIGLLYNHIILFMSLLETFTPCLPLEKYKVMIPLILLGEMQQRYIRVLVDYFCMH
jgi:hypothetical protein